MSEFTVPPYVPKPKQNRIVFVMIRATAAEKAQWSNAAQSDGRSLSSWLRHLAQQETLFNENDKMRSRGRVKDLTSAKL